MTAALVPAAGPAPAELAPVSDAPHLELVKDSHVRLALGAEAVSQSVSKVPDYITAIGAITSNGLVEVRIDPSKVEDLAEIEADTLRI